MISLKKKKKNTNRATEKFEILTKILHQDTPIYY